MIVNGRKVHAGGRNDAPQRSSGVAVFREEPLGGVEDLFFGAVHLIESDVRFNYTYERLGVKIGFRELPGGGTIVGAPRQSGSESIAACRSIRFRLDTNDLNQRCPVDWFVLALQSVQYLCLGERSRSHMQGIHGGQPATLRFISRHPDNRL